MDLNCTKQSSEAGDRKGMRLRFEILRLLLPQLQQQLNYTGKSFICQRTGCGGCEVPIGGGGGGAGWWLVSLGLLKQLSCTCTSAAKMKRNWMKWSSGNYKKRAPKSMQQLLFSNISFSSRFSLCFYRERNANSPFLLIRHTVHIIVMPKLLSVRCVEQKLWYQFTASWSVALALQAD